MTNNSINSNETRYYELVKEVLEDVFGNRGFNHRFEVIGNKKPPLDFLFVNPVLKKYRNRLPQPDVMGVIWRKNQDLRKLVVVEFKENPTFRDIFQTKGYHELFKARISWLISDKPFSESSKAAMVYIRNNPALLETRDNKILYAFLHPVREGAITLGTAGHEFKELDWGAELDKLYMEFE